MSFQIQGKVSVGCQQPSPGRGEDWKSFQFHFHDFANLRTTRGCYVASPEFTCRGNQWELRVFPGGGENAAEGKVSISLYCHRARETIMATYIIKVIDKFGKTKETDVLIKHEFSGRIVGRYFLNAISRSDILDESQNILDSNGALTVVISMQEEPTTVFVPKNPLVKMMKAMFNDENTADICFEVSTAEGNGGDGGGDDDDDDDGNKRAKTTIPLYAHRLILENCAPMLAAICESNESGGVVTASVNDIKPKIFEHLLFYVYGGSVPQEELKAQAKEIIDAADKYSIVNLKLEAEAAYVESTVISLDNAMDDLLYADSRNCALLKEAVMDFLADNHYEAADHISFTDCPGHVIKDLLIAFGKNKKKDGNETNGVAPGVSALRRKHDKMGLEIDGSREAMIETIKSHF